MLSKVEVEVEAILDVICIDEVVIGRMSILVTRDVLGSALSTLKATISNDPDIGLSVLSWLSLGMKVALVVASERDVVESTNEVVKINGVKLVLLVVSVTFCN